MFGFNSKSKKASEKKSHQDYYNARRKEYEEKHRKIVKSNNVRLTACARQDLDRIFMM